MIRHISSVALAIFVISASACAKSDVMCRMYQRDAKVDLEALDDVEAKFRETHGRFTTSFAELSFTPPEPNHYAITIASASGDAYAAKAIGKGDLVGDVWTVDQLGHPVVETNACR